MGGKAFPNYTIPRMSHAQYDALRDKCTAILLSQDFYGQVVCPPEAPSKADHGDVDLLATSPLRAFTPDDVMAALGGVARTKVGATTSFCVPLPPDESASSGAGTAPKQSLYAQIDVHAVPDPALLPWEHFMASYGDLLQIIGRLQRPLGLTANDRGLHVRVPAIEARNRKAAMVFLTHDPGAMLRFLGLDADRFARAGFASDDDLFGWIAECRFFAPALLLRPDPGDETANDRARFAKRPMFTRFMRDWAIQHVDRFEPHREWSRDEVLAEALGSGCFGDAPRDEYARKMALHEAVVREEALLDRIRAAVPVRDEKLVLVMKGLKRWVAFEGGGPILRHDEAERIGDRPAWTHLVEPEQEDAVVQFVLANWELLLLREKQRAGAMKAAKGKAKMLQTARPTELEGASMLLDTS